MRRNMTLTLYRQLYNRLDIDVLAVDQKWLMYHFREERNSLHKDELPHLRLLCELHGVKLVIRTTPKRMKLKWEPE